MKIALIVGTRPNFIKITRFRMVFRELAPHFDLKIIHTGQHFDEKMSDIFFRQFSLVPDVFLNAEKPSSAPDMQEVKKALLKYFSEYRPDLVLVVGDVNSTAAAAMAATEQGIAVGHIESGLRSFDLSMPEEHNRIAADNIARFHFVTEQSGLDNLRKEGKREEGVFFVGNTMIDTMVAFDKEISASGILSKLGVDTGKYILMTMHRPATVDSADGLSALYELLDSVQRSFRVVFPIHPRTMKNIRSFGFEERFAALKNLQLTDPLDYFSFQQLIKESRFILTDSGGIQEESTFRRVPCLTLRPNTERPVTVTLGTNELIPFSLSAITGKISEIESGLYKKGSIPPLWDGHATERIAQALLKNLK